VKELNRFSAEARSYYEQKGGLHYLIQTQGIITTSRNDTPEGLDNHFCINSFSKWIITKNLIPVLKESCIYIHSPATGGEIDLNDVQCRNKGFLDYSKKNPLFIDTITKEFQKRHANLRFYHLFPGFVKSDLLSNSQFNSILTKVTAIISKYLAVEPVAYADHPVYVATHPEAYKSGGLRLTEKNKEYSTYSFLQNETAHAKLFEWCELEQERILSKSSNL